ncbi:MAG: DNA polymerase III subunit gamma/tau, partial [Bacteroidales bacterium]|nr:DNA polymerase III subunit gamma/tau [Bacteroidales bacterium]
MDQFVVSARKYRPDTFESVVGQEAITTTLKNAIRSGHIAQSFLFCGPRGVGKTTCARILAKTINCMNPTPDMEACGECESCRGFQENASQNIYELDAASNRSVEAMRSLIEQVRIPPQVGKYKVYIIDEVHMLTTEAFNAFLKTLEEPPAYAKFILATTERHKILPTILSRCQISDFKRINTEDIVKHLQKIAAAEGLTAEEEALRIIAQKADGGLRDALSMFDQLVSFSNGQVTYNQVISLLNILDYDYYFRFTDLFLKGDHTQLLLLFNQVLDQGFDAQHFVNGLNQHFRNLLLSQDAPTRPLLEMSPALQERYGQQSAQCPPQTLLDGMTLCTRCDLDYRASNNKRLLVEMLLLQICALFGQSVFPSVVSNPTEVEGKPSKETTAEAPSAPQPAAPPAAAAPAPPVAPP